MQREFEVDLKDLFYETPTIINDKETSNQWTKILLRSETQDMDLNISGERKCFHCMKSFDSVQTRIFHEEKLCHLKNVISCSQCCESSIFDDENEAFDHVTNNHDFSELDFFREPTEAFHCLNCCLIFHDEISYWIHYYRRHPKYAKETLCTICEIDVPDLPTYRRHFLIQHCRYTLQCQNCPVVFEDLDCAQKMLQHIKLHHSSTSNIKDFKQDTNSNDDKEILDEYSDNEEDYKIKPKNKRKSMSNNSNTKIIKKGAYVSKSLARSFRSEPLSKEEHYKANMDIALYPPQDPTKVITSFNEVPEAIRDESIRMVDLLRSMPHQITSNQEQLKWDLAMLKCQVTSFSYGIPGESKCFQCSEELKHFNSIAERFNHQFNYHEINGFRCLQCNQDFQDNATLLKHLKKKHCDNYLTPNRQILINEPEFDDQGWLKCQLCPGGFSSEFAFYYHYFESHKPSREALDCKVCGKLAANVMDFKRHILIIHGGYTHSCFLCGKRYGSRDSIASHLRSHGNIANQKNVKSVLGDSGEEMESSRTLSKTLKNRKRKQGKQPPTKTEPRTCLECGWVSKSRLLHDRHLLATHGIQVPQVCQVCQETLADPKDLVEHKRAVHSNDICYICAKSYLTLSDLNLHISRMHPEMANLGSIPENAKNKPIKVVGDKKEKTMCEVCSKMVLSHNIKLHMKNHEEKQITCPKCPRKFRWNSSLTSHLSSAHGDQVKTVTSACEFCGKQFKDKSNLRQHRYSHTGGPYSCKTCGRGFGRKDLLKSHQSKCNPIVSATANILFQ